MKSYLSYVVMGLLYFTIHKVDGQYNKFSLDWNLDAYDKLNYVSGSDHMPYRLLKPQNSDPSTKYPLVIMLHGQGEGIGQSCTNSHGENICNLGWGGKMHLDSSSRYPAYILFPQTYGGSWASGNGADGYSTPPERSINMVIGLLTMLFTKYNIDLNRVYIHGLSAGGEGVWEILARYPHLFAAASPHSATIYSGNARKLIYNPIWTIQGGVDTNPSPGYSRQMMDSLSRYGNPTYYTLNPNTQQQVWPNISTIGSTSIYTLVPGAAHEVWFYLYNSPEWLQWMFSQNKLKISVVGKTVIYSGESVKLGISPGFDAYQWSSGETSNEIVVKQSGDYRVRFKRKTAFWTGESVWSDWSDPVTVTMLPGVRDVTPPTAPRNLAVTSKTYNSVSLSWQPSSDNVGVTGYEVYIGSKMVANTTVPSAVITGLEGGASYTFQVKAYDKEGNHSAAGSALTVTTDIPSTGLVYYYYEGTWTTLPDFNALTPVKKGYVDNFLLTPALRSTNYGFRYEGYMDIAAAGTYTFYTTSDDGSKLFIDNQLVVVNDSLHSLREKSGVITLAQGRHIIKGIYFQNGGGQILEVRYSGPGVNKQLIPNSVLFNQSIADTQPPSAPSGLAVIGKSTTSVSLSWNASSDNIGVTGYEVYANGNLVAVVSSTGTTVASLQPATAYTFTVKGKDAAANLSPASNAVTVTTDPLSTGNGVKYSYYEGTWSTMPDFTSMVPVKTGVVSNFDITPRVKNDYFAFKYETYIDIPVAGNYTFYVSSDDGSLIYLDNQKVVDNNGLHGTKEVSGAINLSKGKHKMEVDYLEYTGTQILTVSYSGPGITKMLVPNAVLYLNDAQQASQPLALSAKSETATSVDLMWNKIVSATDITYEIYNGNALTEVTADTFYSVTGLSPATAYDFTVQAKDNSENVIVQSHILSVTTKSPNNDPVIAALSDTTMKEADSLAISLSAQDPDGDSVQLTILNIPVFGRFTNNGNGTGSILFTPGYNDAGTYLISVQASDPNGGNDIKSFVLKVTEVIPKGNLVLYRINSGGYPLNAPAGDKPWQQDNYQNPSPYVNIADAGNKTFTTSDSIVVTPLVPAGTPSTIFQSERSIETGNRLQYALPVAPGSEVEVRLYFAEIYFQEANKRKFNIEIEDTLRQSGYDVYAEAGFDAGTMKSYVIKSDGEININLIKVIDNPKINGIEVVCMNDVCNNNNLRIARSNSPLPDDANARATSVYPNPFTNNVSVKLANPDAATQLIIYNSMGEKIQEQTMEGEDTHIDLSAYPVGTYFLEVTSGQDESKEVVRLVKY